ncbi:transglutaminase-like domain-containing protein [Gehongia tenuis]|uniref:Transglutaminase domain-containing protein n=1 Tax=Gehongia tenuis TaxID=2763655 RepID=A0A926HLF7_9FIRM|nr:transglutaminase-like domain-containing protein [Gehongia tenuis]MBC8532022.1 transglutaminase domain-containing protein [Gehongia tenuis]
MTQRTRRGLLWLQSLVLILTLTNCSAPPAASPAAEASPNAEEETPLREKVKVRMPEAGDTEVAENDEVRIDTSHKADGYVMLTCITGRDKRVKAQIKCGDKVYNYDLNHEGRSETFPLQCGDGSYAISVLENIVDNRYTPLLTAEVEVVLSSAYAPFLVPNQMVDYTPDSQAVLEGQALTADARSDLDVVHDVFQYIVNNIDYDDAKAETVQTRKDYLPSVDDTLEERKGICYDYASLFAAMLRSQGIPTKLVTGYVEPLDVYHAWNLVYIKDVGWVEMKIYFDGENWQLVDTTFAASNTDGDLQYETVYEY